MKKQSSFKKYAVWLFAAVGVIVIAAKLYEKNYQKKIDAMAIKRVTALQLALDLIISFEGFSAKAFWDYKQYTYGYGTKAPGKNATITRANARVELEKDVKVRLYKIVSAIKRPVSDNCIAALTSFSYNLGNATVLINDINDGETMQTVANRMNRYINAGGVPSPGLIARRAKETTFLLA